MNGKINEIISIWLKCEITGDGAMSQIIKILEEDERRKNEIINACTKEKS